MSTLQVATLVLFIATFLLGLLVYLKDRTIRLNRVWFIFCSLAASWAFCLYLVTSAPNAVWALRWQYLLDLFALGIPISYFYFVRTFLGSRGTTWREGVLSFVTLALAVFSFSSLFKLGVEKKFDFYWVEPGALYFIFPVVFLSIVFISISLLVKAFWKNKINPSYQRQIKYQIIAGIVGFLSGATNFLPQLFNIFPFGSYVVLIYVSFVSYLILKYQLFNVKLIFVEIAIILLNVVLSLNLIFSRDHGILILNIVVAIFVLALSVFLIRGIHKDISDRKRIEGLVKDRASANEHLKALEQQKTEFVSIASHQLRTPMTVIKGYASMILEGAFGVLPPQAKDAMTKLYQSSEKIVALVEDLLTVSRIEQGRGMPVFETVPFVDFMRSLSLKIFADAESRGFQVSFSADEGTEDVRVSVDTKKFEQAFKHLADNALRYTTPPGNITIHITRDFATHRVDIALSDTGIGMNQEQIRRLTEDARSTESSREGSFGFSIKERQGDGTITHAEEIKKRVGGIGYFIAQEIITAHYGTIRVESPGLGKGTTVIIELPEFA